MNCDKAELAVLHFYGELPPQGEISFEAHLPSCPECRGLLAALAAGSSGLGALAAEPGPAVSAAVLAAARSEASMQRAMFGSFRRALASAALAGLLAVSFAASRPEAQELKWQYDVEDRLEEVEYSLAQLEYASSDAGGADFDFKYGALQEKGGRV